jgi:hypothetical protein
MCTARLRADAPLPLARLNCLPCCVPMMVRKGSISAGSTRIVSPDVV